ncbi:hypothetical protein HU200_038793 [Digitaria exilis]|uniref:Wax synthase domain-containing protein n=1 Tax=Digitaria exilis TaxID=1010633 RepID=A0A835BHJ8_9POAL|nr:hypothetical protein HU200_038793 [Digitaria exilis]
MVFLAVSAAALYARAASSCVRPGFPRLLALLPVAALLAAAPLAFPFANVRGLTGFFLGWLGVFKLLLLAAGRGPLEPNLPAHQFLFVAALPVKLTDRRHGQPGLRSPAASKSKSTSTMPLVSCAVKVAAMAAILHAYKYASQLHLYIRLALYGVHIYCFLDLLLPCIAAAGAALGMEMEPQFDRPYIASSLRDFWGRRWNLMVTAILRPSVYDPVRARTGKPTAAMATFLVSGLMHEAMVYYLTLRMPTGGEMTAFFVLHGACCVAEAFCAGRWAVKGWAPPPRPLATVLVVVFVAGTAFWLFFPTICREGSEEALLEELAAVTAFFEGAGRKLLLRYV